MFFESCFYLPACFPDVSIFSYLTAKSYLNINNWDLAKCTEQLDTSTYLLNSYEQYGQNVTAQATYPNTWILTLRGKNRDFWTCVLEDI